MPLFLASTQQIVVADINNIRATGSTAIICSKAKIIAYKDIFVKACTEQYKYTSVGFFTAQGTSYSRSAVYFPPRIDMQHDL